MTDIRNHSPDNMTGLGELEGITEPVAVVVRPDGSLDVYGRVGVVDQRPALRRVKVYFRTTTDHEATLDYDELAELAAQNGGLKVPSPHELGRQGRVALERPVWSGAELGEVLWERGRQIDSSETLITGLEGCAE
jgi:hypothetical protein